LQFLSQQYKNIENNKYIRKKKIWCTTGGTQCL